MADGTVKYMAKRGVVSTRTVKLGEFCHFSVLDRLMEQNQVKIVYYYPSRVDHVEPGEWIKKLGVSLSSVLTNYPIITGRLQKNQEGHWRVKCNDGGIRILEAKVRGTVEDWLKSVDREKELKLVYWEDMFHKPYFWSLLYAQVTEFEKGGLAIGLSCSHLLADPICATMFLKAWADITISGIMSTPPLFDSLPLTKANSKKNPNQESYTDLIDYYKSSIERQIPLINNQKYTTVTLSFTDSMVRDCIAMAQATGTSGKSSSPAFEALAALFWVCLSKVKGTKSGRLFNMSLCLDMRTCLGLDQGFFGNCMVYNRVHLESAGENVLPEAAKAISEVVQKMNAEGIQGLIEWLQCDDDQTVPLMNCYDLVCVNLEGVNPYLARFRDGCQPVRASCYVEPMVGAGQVLISRAAPCEGPLSRVVMATLPEDEVAKLCEDDLMLRFPPTVLMGTNKN